MVSTMGLQGFLPWVYTTPDGCTPLAGATPPRPPSLASSPRPARSCSVQKPGVFASRLSPFSRRLKTSASPTVHCGDTVGTGHPPRRTSVVDRPPPTSPPRKKTTTLLLPNDLTIFTIKRHSHQKLGKNTLILLILT
jgi:hypothetical protein